MKTGGPGAAKHKFRVEIQKFHENCDRIMIFHGNDEMLTILAKSAYFLRPGPPATPSVGNVFPPLGDGAPHFGENHAFPCNSHHFW